MLDIRLLGGFAVQVDGTDVPDDAWRLRKARALVKLLALAPGHRMHREQVYRAAVAGQGGRARAQQQPAPGGLRRAPRARGGGRRRRGDPGAARRRASACTATSTVDAVELEARDRRGARRRRALAAYEAALAGAGGELLPEDRYEDWTTDRRDALRELVITAYLELAALQELPDDAAEVLQRALALDPLHERATRPLMRAYADAGRRQRALEAFEHLRGALRDAYGADPDEETRRLYRELLTARRERRRRRAATPLPLALTSFIGRERELGEVARLLERTRLLTITGPGGSGKTRLALEAAARREGEVGLVELAPLADPALLPSPVAGGLGVSLADRRRPDRGARARDRDARAAAGPRQLRAPRQRRRASWPPGCSRAARGCTSSPRAASRCTSTARSPGARRRCRCPPSDDDPRSSEAVSLFVDRAAAAAPELELGDEDLAAAAAICRRLDGMPLAIELAAARIRHLSPAQLAERLGTALDVLGTGSRTALDRQQTLRATLDWSYELLDDDERELFAALSVFAGDFDIAAAEAVGGGSLDVLGRLVDKSLVLADRQDHEVRYRLLETFRQYGLEHLADPADADRRASPALPRRWPSRLAPVGRAAARTTAGSACSPPSTRTCARRSRPACATTRRRRCGWSRRCAGSGSTAGTWSRGCAGTRRRWTRGPSATRCAHAR